MHFFYLLFFQNYMMFVSWSDQNNILIYRTFEDFKRFHVSEYFPEKHDSCPGEGKKGPSHVSGLRSTILSFSSLIERAEEKIPH